MKRKIAVLLLVCALAGFTAIASATQYNPPWADDYDFNYPDLSTTPTASNAASNQNNIGYSSFAHTNVGAGSAYNWLKDDAIFFANGHGLKYDTGEKGGAIEFYDGNQYSWLVASRNNIHPQNPYYLSDYTSEITDVLLAVYVACYSGYTNTYNGNLLDVSINKGVDAAIGFSDLISNSKSNYWSDRFWYRTKNGETIYNAAINAKEDTWWTFPFGYGGVDTIVLRGSTGNSLSPARYGS